MQREQSDCLNIYRHVYRDFTTISIPYYQFSKTNLKLSRNMEL